MPQCRYAPFSDRPFFLSIGSTGRSCASHSQQILDFCLRFGKTMVAIPDRPIWLDRNIQKNVLVIVIIVHNWLVVYLPLRKICVRQLGWWHSQYDGKNKAMFQTTNQIKLVNHRFGWLINTSFIFKRKKTEWDQFHIVFLDPKHGFIPKMEDAPKFASHKISIFCLTMTFPVSFRLTTPCLASPVLLLSGKSNGWNDDFSQLRLP